MIRSRRRRKTWLYGLAALLLTGSYAYWALQKPLPLLQPQVATTRFQTAAIDPALSWPAQGQAAVSIMGTDIITTHGQQSPAPSASTIKVLTALTVLKAKPLAKGEQGPVVTLTDVDVGYLQYHAAMGGSLLPITAGEQLSQYQLLQALMLPSANNIADTLAVWAFGSLENYHKAANTYLAEHGLTNTRVGGDASGLSPITTSTAGDLVQLGELAMKNEVLAEIVGQPAANGFPIVNNIRNSNGLLGQANIIGIKTGTTDPAGGVLVTASRVTINNQPVTLITAVMGSPNRYTVLGDSLALVQSAQTNFQAINLVKAGTPVGRYDVPWGASVTAVAFQNLDTTAWKGSAIEARAHLKTIGYKDKIAGRVTLSRSGLSAEKSSDVVLQKTPAPPSIWWRLTHPLN